MALKYLMDSNVIIDYLGHKLPASAAVFIDSLPDSFSVVTRIEIVGWYKASPLQIEN
jgi:hypothetical protein